VRDYWRAWFAPDRPDEVGMAAAVMIERVASKLAAERGLGLPNVTASRFFMGYLLGYPACVDQASRRRGDDIRTALFRHFYGGDATEILAIARRKLDSDEPQTLRGAGFGQRDGLQYFHDKSAGQESKTCTAGLRSAFDLGEIDLNAGLLQAA
jgi:hypothetical protein